MHNIPKTTSLFIMDAKILKNLLALTSTIPRGAAAF
jgi:hypothetical protein